MAKYYVDGAGNFLWGWADDTGPAQPAGSTEVGSGPSDLMQKWDGSSWIYPKDSLKAILAEHRYNKENGGVNVSGIFVRTDDRSKNLLSGKKSKAVDENDPTKVNKVKLESGFTDLTNQQLIDIFGVVADHVQKCFDCEATVYVLIDDGTYTTPQQVTDAFDAAYIA